MGCCVLDRDLWRLQAVRRRRYTLHLTSRLTPARRNPKVYLETIRHLALPAEKCAMVAAHMFDVRGAAAVGLKTVYVVRPTEDGGEGDKVKAKREGGEFDVVVRSITELADLVAK